MNKLNLHLCLFGTRVVEIVVSFVGLLFFVHTKTSYVFWLMINAFWNLAVSSSVMPYMAGYVLAGTPLSPCMTWLLTVLVFTDWAFDGFGWYLLLALAETEQYIFGLALAVLKFAWLFVFSTLGMTESCSSRE